ncbi:MAG TPA: hypothetical protein VFX47_01025 [Gammaproteobacteria bacterium]|nr:hypothetical protein [Gammaproteobacteria bacterium]
MIRWERESAGFRGKQESISFLGHSSLTAMDDGNADFAEAKICPLE